MKWFSDKFLIMILVLYVVQGCAQSPVYTTPVGYNFDQGEKYFLPESLTEISGISFHHGNADSMYGIQDETARLYYFKPGVKSVTYSIFGKSGDFEDVSISKDRVIVLKSNGTLISFPFAESRDTYVNSVKTWKGLVPKGEYESMYVDPETNIIYVICKNCQQDKKADLVSGYMLQLTDNDSVYAANSFTIDTEPILKKETDKKKKDLRPSAISKHPLTGDWYIVASVNKCLVVLDANWKIKEQHFLDPSKFRQPEGLTFDKDGNLYISNEGDDLGVANIWKFLYQPQTL